MSLHNLKTTVFMLIAAAGLWAQDSGSSENAAVLKEIGEIENLFPHLPDRAPALFELAHDYARLGNLKKAMSLLKECVSFHEGFDPESDPAFNPLKNDAEFAAIIQQVHREFPAVRSARLAFTIPQPDLIPEGLAVDIKDQVFYMGSLSRKKIIKINLAGTTADFVPSGRYDLQSICGIKVDPSNQHVWANTCPDSGRVAELLHFDNQGRLVERFNQSTPGPHLLNDLVLRNASEIYVTDSLSHQALRFDRNKHVFTALSFSRPLYYPNGIAISEDGNLLYVADAFGVLQYDLRTQKAREVQAGRGNTVSGFDGLYWYRGGLVGIQNSMGMPRVAQFQLSDDGGRVIKAAILEYRSDYVELPTTGAITGSEFYFMANTQIDHWKDDRIVDAAKLAPVRVAVVQLN